ncbi:MAG: hypothetical protein ABF428_10615, partial [Liquorilactobacillus satsumensis]
TNSSNLPFSYILRVPFTQQLNLSSQKLLEDQKSEQNINNHPKRSRQNASKDDHNDTDTNTSEQNKKPSNRIREHKNKFMSWFFGD